MSKYSNLYSDIYAFFAAPAWSNEGIKTIPSNFVTKGLGNEFIRLNIIPSGIINAPNSSSGQLIIDIFVAAGDGHKRLAAIADKLDTYLVKKSKATTLNGVTQFGDSALVPVGFDTANPSLYRGNYSISFNYFGK